jgi:hypothetical protein
MLMAESLQLLELRAPVKIPSTVIVIGLIWAADVIPGHQKILCRMTCGHSDPPQASHLEAVSAWCPEIPALTLVQHFISSNIYQEH